MSPNIYLWIYVIVAIAVTIGGTYKLYGMENTLGALLFFVGAIFLFMSYGLRWFGVKDSIFSNTPVQWPPAINTCPDFLTYYQRENADGTKVDSCIDLLGISKNGTLKRFPKDGSIPTTDEFYFSLVTTNSDPVKKNNELCQRAITAGLTWEGITNGESCVNPDGTVGPGSGSSSNSNCPSS
jgi:hypothetical protein